MGTLYSKLLLIQSASVPKDGMRAAEATLFLRKEMLTSGEEGLLLAFAENGTDRTAILRLYKEILSG
jgi:hypothetical protein